MVYNALFHPAFPMEGGVSQGRPEYIAPHERGVRSFNLTNIYADRLIDIITDGMVPIKEEKEAEERFEKILSTVPKYGKNDTTLARYLNYHREIQDLFHH
jgi:hypothetical protein